MLTCNVFTHNLFALTFAAVSPVAGQRITYMEAKWTVGGTPAVGGAFYSPWYGIETSDNLNLYQPGKCRKSLNLRCAAPKPDELAVESASLAALRVTAETSLHAAAAAAAPGLQ